MPTTIDLTAARRLLQSRDDLTTAGDTERDVRARVASDDLLRVRRGRYVETARWNALWNEGRHLLQVLAAHENSDAPGPVFWGPSAAVLHRLPLCRLAPANVHTVILGARHGRSRAKVVWHNVEIAAEDVDWHARMGRRAESISVRGIRKARDLIAFADGRAQLPGESVSRLHLRELGFRDVMLQTHVVGPEGEDYWLDFGFRRSRVFGEFDGAIKYLDPVMRRGRALDEILLAEKRREDTIRGVTGWRTARWGWDDVRTPDALAARLAAFGIRPPG